MVRLGMWEQTAAERRCVRTDAKEEMEPGNGYKKTPAEIDEAISAGDSDADAPFEEGKHFA